MATKEETRYTSEDPQNKITSRNSKKSVQGESEKGERVE